MPNGKAPPLEHLQSGELTLDLAPWLGGSVTAFRCGGIDLFRPTPSAAIEERQVRRTGAFALVPYSNRIAHGRFAFGGETFQLAPFPAGQPHATHGNGWQRPWTVTERSAVSCTMRLDHPAASPDWPYAFRVTQRFTLSDASLRVGLELENRDHGAMPAGLGWHPYFPLRPDTRLAFSAQDVWLTDEELLPTSKVPVPEAWNFTGAKLVARTRLNHCFTGWNRRARIALGAGLPNLSLTASTTFPLAIVYAPEGGDFFAFEPVTHMPDAINRPAVDAEDAMSVVRPGEQLAGEIELAVSIATA